MRVDCPRCNAWVELGTQAHEKCSVCGYEFGSVDLQPSSPLGDVERDRTELQVELSEQVERLREQLRVWHETFAEMSTRVVLETAMRVNGVDGATRRKVLQAFDRIEQSR